jgi:hypothetical protein
VSRVLQVLFGFARTQRHGTHAQARTLRPPRAVRAEGACGVLLASAWHKSMPAFLCVTKVLVHQCGHAGRVFRNSREPDAGPSSSPMVRASAGRGICPHACLTSGNDSRAALTAPGRLQAISTVEAFAICQRGKGRAERNLQRLGPFCAKSRRGRAVNSRGSSRGRFADDDLLGPVGGSRVRDHPGADGWPHRMPHRIQTPADHRRLVPDNPAGAKRLAGRLLRDARASRCRSLIWQFLSQPGQGFKGDTGQRGPVSPTGVSGPVPR